MCICNAVLYCVLVKVPDMIGREVPLSPFFNSVLNSPGVRILLCAKTSIKAFYNGEAHVPESLFPSRNARTLSLILGVAWLVKKCYRKGEFSISYSLPRVSRGTYIELNPWRS